MSKNRYLCFWGHFGGGGHAADARGLHGGSRGLSRDLSVVLASLRSQLAFSRDLHGGCREVSRDFRVKTVPNLQTAIYTGTSPGCHGEVHVIPGYFGLLYPVRGSVPAHKPPNGQKRPGLPVKR